MSAPFGHTIVPSSSSTHHLAEQIQIRTQGLKNRAPELPFEIDLAFRAVVEREPHGEPVERFGGDDAGGLHCHGNGGIVSSGSRARALARFPSSSVRCSIAHSLTSLSALGGS